MAEDSRDRELGMHRKITRRDFLDGAAMAVGAAALEGATLGLRAPGGETGGSERPAYPPALTGLRGDQNRGFETAHKLRDGKSWEALGTVEDDAESYDLIVVGAGISGLAA